MTIPSTSRLIIGCGYLGRRVAARWIDAGDRVTALTRTIDRANELSTMGIEPVVGEILVPETLQDLPPVTTVLYAVGYDRTSGASQRDVSIDGLRNVLAALPSSVERLVYVSSTSVYGQSAGEWVDESSPCNPSTESGRICLDAERLVQEMLANRLSVHVLRLSGIYGPSRLIARIDGLREGRPLPTHPDGWLNLIHVDDAANVVLRCSDHDATETNVTLVSDDRPLRRREFYDTLAKLVPAPSPVFEPPPEEPPNLGKRCDNRRLREDWGISLTFPTIETGLRHAVLDGC